MIVGPRHPDWDELWENILQRELFWLFNYFKSHDINQCTDEQGNTLLHHAALLDNSDAVIYLFYLLIDPNIKNAAGQTALQIAQDTEAQCIRDLHKYHLCIDFIEASTEPNGLEALFAAIHRGDTTIGDTSGVKNDGNEVKEGKWAALQCAAMYDRPHLIRALHQRFPNLNPDYDVGFHGSALEIATKYGHSNCIIALHDCFPAIKADGALQVACRYNHPACIPILRQCFPQLTGNELDDKTGFSSALMRATHSNHLECIRTLHSCFPEIDPNLQDLFDNTALMATVKSHPSPDCLSVLSECFPDIDPNKQCNAGNTALMYATRRGLSDWIALIRSYFPNIDVNKRNTQGKTALMNVNFNNGDTCLITLCEYFPDLDPNIQDKDGNTALMLVDYTAPIEFQLHKWLPNIGTNVQHNTQQTTLMRMVSKMNPNIKNNKHQTALMRMVSKRCSVESMCKFLDTFPNIIDINMQTGKGDTALTLAIKHGNVLLVALLLERFPDIDLNLYQPRGKPTGQTVIALAIVKNQRRVLSMLLEHIIQICRD